jgi:hypothetical protein
MSIEQGSHLTRRELEDLEAMRHAPYPSPHTDRGETLALTGVGIGLMGVGVVALSAICMPCMIGAAPIAAAAAPVLLGAGAFQRWRSRPTAPSSDRATACSSLQSTPPRQR